LKAIPIRNVFRSSVGKEKLLRLKLKALRRGLWFKVLSPIDRALVNLTVRVVEEIRSAALAERIRNIMGKLETALENKVLHALKTVGIPLARKLSSLAQKWGNPKARSWADDLSYAKFLAIIHLNNSPLFKA
jgi:hypothetical protein